VFKKLLFILLLSLISLSGYGQTIFTQTFIDRCTGDVKVVNANFVNGSATVAFYNRVRLFTYQEALNGTLQAWLNETYNWWNTLSPCSTTTQQTQQAQQTAQAAQQAAQTAATAASTVVIPPTPPTTPPPTNTPPPTSGSTTTTTSTSGTSPNSSSSSSSSSSSGSGGSTSEGSGSSSGGSSETKSETTETKTETKTEEKKTETKSEEKKTEEKKTEEKKEEKKEETKEEEKKEEEKKEEEKKEEEKKEEEKKEEEDKKKQRNMMPIQLKADLMAMQNPLGGFNAAMSFSASQSSIFGDVSYGANLMVFDNLRQATLGLNRSKVFMDDSYNVEWVESTGINYANNFGTQAVSGNFMRLKPMGKKGTFGFGVNYTLMFGNLIDKPMGNVGYNFLYTNSYELNQKRITYAPAFIVAQTPLSFTLDGSSTTTSDAMFILANSWTYRLTKRFTFNFGYTAIKSTNPIIPLINSFMIGSKIPF
jgi:type II secretory pathway pseudopilin PulG